MSGAAEAGSSSRHQGREVALQVLYAVDLAGHESPRRDAACDTELDAEGEPVVESGEGGIRRPPSVEEGARIFARVTEHFSVPKGAIEFAETLALGVVSRLPELDSLVSLHARNWRVSRMAVVDRNVLRLGAHELCHTDTPVAVVIDEAVDLARRFGSDRSPAFVNGVLDAIAKEVRGA